MVTPVMKAAIIASTAVSVYSAVQQGKYAKAAADAEAKQYEEQKRMAELKAVEDANSRKRDWLESSASNRALFAAKTGTDPNESASFLALRESNELTAGRDLGAIRLMGASQSRKYDLSSWNSKMSGKAAMTSAYGKASSSLLSGYRDLNA